MKQEEAPDSSSSNLSSSTFSRGRISYRTKGNTTGGGYAYKKAKWLINRSLKRNWFTLRVIDINPPIVALSCLVAVDKFCCRNLVCLMNVVICRMSIGNLHNWWPPLGPAEVLINGCKTLPPNLNKKICLTCHVNYN